MKYKIYKPNNKTKRNFKNIQQINIYDKQVKPKYKYKHKSKPKPKTIKIYVGGRPKINFPYTYFIINYLTFRQYYNILNPYLNLQTNICNDLSIGKTLNIDEQNNNSFLNENEICILVLKYDDVYLLNKDINLLNNQNFLNKILGHTKIIFYEQLQIIGIFNICLHSIDFINQNSQIIKQYKKKNIGYGSVLFNCVLTCIIHELNLEKRYKYLWLGINLNNVEFNKIAWLYICNGFGNPTITNITPNGIQMPFLFLQLTKEINKYINTRDDALIPYYETIDLYNQIKNNTNLSKECIFSFHFNFDKSTILNLRLAPFLSFTENKEIIGIKDISLQREISGILKKYKSYVKNEEIINTLSFETMDYNFPIYEIGDSKAVDIKFGASINYHTHPIINYSINNVLIGPPSGIDMALFYKIYVISMDKNIQIQFHCVISIEGIYIYSLTPQAILYIYQNLQNKTLTQIQLDNTLKYIEKVFDYPFNERQYNWENYYNDNNIDENLINRHIQKYMDWFNKINNENDFFKNLFNIQFSSWRDFTNEKIFTIYYFNKIFQINSLLQEEKNTLQNRNSLS